MGAHRAETTTRTRARVGGTLLLLGASLAVATPTAFAAIPGSTGSADGGTVTGGSGGNATSQNSNGGTGGQAGRGGDGGQGGDYTEETSPSTSSGALGSGLLGTSTTPSTTAPGTSTAGTYYPDCKAVFAAGLSDIPRGAPGYRPALDGDNDGYACDTRTGAGGRQ